MGCAVDKAGRGMAVMGMLVEQTDSNAPSRHQKEVRDNLPFTS